MKITKKLREQAAMVCAAAACVRSKSETGGTMVYDHIGNLLGVSRAARKLALDAWHAAPNPTDEWRPDRGWTQARDAEAEALLRTGFVPEGWS